MPIARTAVVGVLFSILLPLTAHAAVSGAERQALLDLFNSAGGPNWKSHTNWGGAPGTECTWDYVTCDASQTTVTALDLGYNNLKGSLPSSIGSLTGLVRLYLVGNELTGLIPNSIGSLTNLEVLNLNGYYDNEFSGPIPPEMGNLAKLRQLELEANSLTGTIPATFAGLVSIEKLDVSYNHLTGTLPGFLFQRTTLKSLDLSENQFTGTIPAPIALPNLESLSIGINQITGTIPPDIGQLTNLTRLDLGDNQLTGAIPANIANLAKLEGFSVSRNNLTGGLSTFTGIVSLKSLDLSHNHLTGGIPASIGNLTRLETLYIGSNDFGGTIPPEISNLRALTGIELSSDGLTGPIPREIVLLPKLNYLDLSFNQLTGGIPPELASATALDSLDLRDNLLNGTIPDTTLAPLTNLRNLSFQSNYFSGPLPASLGTLSRMEFLLLGSNLFSGAIPAGIWKLPALRGLSVDNNQLTGTIPAEIGQLPAIEFLYLSSNGFSGAIPVEVTSLRTLIELKLGNNRLSGAIPPQLGLLSKLERLELDGNDLTGGIPTELATLASLQYLYLGQNHLSGTIPPQLGQLASLKRLFLEGNLLSGAIPPEIGQLANLQALGLIWNQLRGTIPVQLMSLTSLVNGSSDFRYNALTTNDAALRAFLNRKQYGGDFESYQTVAPTGLAIGGTTSSSVTLTWTPIAYQSDEGGYRILASFSADGEYSTLAVTDSKRDRVWTVSGLLPSRQYFFKLATATYPSVDQQSAIVSDPTPAVGASTLPPVLAPAQIVAATLPAGILQTAGAGGGTDSYALTNVGDLSTTITLSQNGDFFTQSPASLTLAGGESREVILTGAARPVGIYEGQSIPSGSGVPAGLVISVRMLASAPISAGIPDAQPVVNRVDVVAPAGTDPSGSVGFINLGTAPVVGFLVTDVPWLVPQSGIVTIAPGATESRTFGVARSLRPDQTGAAAGRISLVYPRNSGATSGSASLVYPRGSGAARVALDASPPAATITIVDTVKPGVTLSGIPPLAPGEVAILLPFIGHVKGSSGEYLTDVSISNVGIAKTPPGIRVYFTQAAADPAQSSQTNLTELGAGVSILLADVVKNVFGFDGQLGTVQVRGPSLDKVVVSATVFNIADRRGTYGNSIPVFRSDRSLAPGNSLWLTGLRKSSSTRTNLFVQEAAGGAANFEIEFFAPDGTPVGTKLSLSAAGFRLVPLGDAVPEGAVAARLTNLASSQGRLVAYATPVDLQSGDTWSLVDWNVFFQTDPREVSLIPIVGSLHGANDSFFRSDVAVTNRGTSIANGVLEYWSRNERLEREITLEPKQTLVVNDLVGTYFPSRPESFGYALITPRTGELSVSSRTFTTTGTSVGTFGVGVPTLTLASGLRVGQSKLISGLELSRPSTILARKPGSFRTNVGLIETAGKSAKVRITVVFPDLGQLASTTRIASFDFDLQPRDALLVLNLSDRIAAIRPVGDLRNVQLQFQVLSGDGAVTVFTSSLDNGSQDALLRIE